MANLVTTLVHDASDIIIILGGIPCGRSGTNWTAGRALERSVSVWKPFVYAHTSVVLGCNFGISLTILMEQSYQNIYFLSRRSGLGVGNISNQDEVKCPPSLNNLIYPKEFQSSHS